MPVCLWTPVESILYDNSSGVGGTQYTSATTTTFNFTLDISSQSTGIVIYTGYFLGSSVTLTSGYPTCSVGSSSAMLVSSYSNNNLYLTTFTLLSPPTGSQTVTLNFSYNRRSVLETWGTAAISYEGVSTFGIPITADGISTLPSLSTPTSAYKLVSQAFVNNTAGSTVNALTGYNKTLRISQLGYGANANSFIAGDALGSSSLVFSVGHPSTTVWNATAIPMS